MSVAGGADERLTGYAYSILLENGQVLAISENEKLN
jgi:hypothetical protein